MVGGKDFIAGLKGQGTGYQVDSIGGVGDEGQIVGGGVQVGPQNFPGCMVVLSVLATQKTDWLLFEAQLPILVNPKNLFWASSKRTVVEKDNVLIE